MKKNTFYLAGSDCISKLDEEAEKMGAFYSPLGYVFPLMCPLAEKIAKENNRFVGLLHTDLSFEAFKKKMTNPNKNDGPVKVYEDPEKMLEEMNNKWALLENPPSLLNISRKGSPLFYKKDDFYTLLGNKFFPVQEEKAVKNVPLAKWWIRNEGRKVFKGIVFDAEKTPFQYSEGVGIFYLNLWKGLAIKPAEEGDCSLILSHMKEVICAGHEDYYDFLMKLFATWVQKPWERTLCPVLRSQQGTGKKILPDLFSRIFGSAFLSSSNHQHVFGHFNAIIEDKIVIELNEAMFGGDKQLSGPMKSALTDDTVMITRKGKNSYPIKNQKKYFITSNEDFAIPVDKRGRRFLFLDVSPCRKGDTAYFNDLYGSIERGGGAEAFLACLTSIDLEGFDHRNLPSWATRFGATNKLEAANGLIKYLYDVLCLGYLDVTGDIGDEGNYWKDDGFTRKAVWDCYSSYSDRNRHMRKIGRLTTGRILKEIFGDECSFQYGSGDLRGQRGYRFGTLENAREKYCKSMGVDKEIFE